MFERFSSQNSECALSVTLSEGAENLLDLAYSVTNLSQRPLCMLDQFGNAVAPFGGSEGKNSYVAETRGDVLVLSRKFIATPAGMFVEQTFIPYVTIVSPGQTAGDVIHLANPVTPWHPYLEPDEAVEDGPPARLFSFELGYFLSTIDALELFERQGKFTRPEAFDEAAQTVIGVGPFRRRIEISRQP